MNRRPGPLVYDDDLRRDFTAPAANQVWLTDITEHPAREGKLYAYCIKDVFSNRIVGISMSERMTASLAMGALENAITATARHNTIVHSDRGSQFRSTAYTTTPKANGLKRSMGRVGEFADNEAMESFFSPLQNNVLNTRTWNIRDEVQAAITHCIEGTCHRRRRQLTLGKITPPRI